MLIRMPSNKLPKGRHLIGDSVVYDVGVWLPREFQPQLEGEYSGFEYTHCIEFVVSSSYTEVHRHGFLCRGCSPIKCPVEKLIDGVQFVGKHDGEVTDLSMCQWMTTRLVSASMDGTVAGPYGLPLTPARRALFIVYRTALPYVGERISSRAANRGILLADSQSDEVYSISAQSSSITCAASSSTPPASVSALKRLKQRLNELWLSAVWKWPTVHL